MRFLILFLFIATYFSYFSQTVIWSEDFQSYTDGTQNAVKWTTSAGNCDLDGIPLAVGNNYWGVRTTLGDKEFCCEDIEGLTCCLNEQGQSDNIWLSENINISGYSTISISIFFRAEGDMECNSCGLGQDLLKVEYQIDGGSWVNFVSVCGLQNGSSILDCIDITSGSILKIRVLLGNQADTEEYYFDDIFVYESTCSIVLPIELLSFNGSHNYDTGYNELEWITASELNNDRFDIYSSIDGENWSLVGSVKGVGTSNMQNNYNFNHRSESNLVYYRLKQVDYDGEYKYSDIISVSREGEIVIGYYDLIGRELQEEPNSGIYIKVIKDGLKTDYKKIFKLF
jgi:hypothetical protein